MACTCWRLACLKTTNLLITFDVHSDLKQWCADVVELVDHIVIALLCGRMLKFLLIASCEQMLMVDSHAILVSL